MRQLKIGASHALTFYNATSFGYGHSVIRASDKMKSLLEIYTANVNRDLIGTL